MGISRTAPSGRRSRHVLLWIMVPLVACLLGLRGSAAASDRRSLSVALESITAGDIQRHIDVLADDIFEGREAGSRGGRAAGTYLRKALRKAGLVGAAGHGAYFQPFSNGYRNLLAMLPGSDPRLKEEFVLVGAHYDHVGYGTRRNSYGPIGLIHNGADDNASGCAAVLELVDAFTQLEATPRRSILFALWDGEEKGLLGSRHWVAHPTVPLDRVRVALNMDMVGRLRGERLEVAGTRTTRGTRRTFGLANTGPHLRLDFTWKLTANSDHWPLIERRIPSLLVHTGLHSDYHRPSDDAHLINAPGARRVVRLVFDVVYRWAESETLAGYRAAGRRESEASRRWRERPLPPLPARLGVRWSPRAPSPPSPSQPGGSHARPEGVVLTSVRPGSPADHAGLAAGDRIVTLAGHPIRDGADLRRAVALAPRETQAVVVRREAADQPAARRSLPVTLAGHPVRVGISWRADDAEPGLALITRVVPGSPAADAGLRVGDRIYAVDDMPLEDRDDLADRLRQASGPIALRVENGGRLRSVTVVLPPRDAS